MADYIKRETVLNHLRECEGTPPEIGYTFPLYKAIQCFVEQTPSADVVEVVRCKNCRKYKVIMNRGGEIEFFCTLWSNEAEGERFYTFPDFYCAEGERKDNV